MEEAEKEGKEEGEEEAEQSGQHAPFYISLIYGKWLYLHMVNFPDSLGFLSMLYDPLEVT